MYGAVGSDSIYSAIHEFGGTITANASDYLKFKGKNGWVKVKSVTIPRRPWMSPSIIKNKEVGSDLIIDNINRRIKYGY